MTAVRGGFRSSAWMVVLSLALPAAGLASCSAAECSGDTIGFDATFVGRLTATHLADGTADFAVESVRVEPGRATTHLPVAGDAIAVHYDGGGERFLHVGARYAVSEAFVDGRFVSGVHVASDPCSGGTVHADGSAIDTSNVAWLRARHIFTAVLVAPIVALAVLSAALGWRRRRRPVTVRVDDRYL